MRVPSPSMFVALAALFVALGGVGVAATGDNFILGQTNTASSQSTLNAPVAGGKALQVINTDNTNAASTALGLVAAAGHPPMTVNTSTKVANLNADSLDGLDSTKFLRSSIPLSLTGASPSGVINGTNTGGGNGLQGVSGNSNASGVYGQNDDGGFGVAGRSNHPGGTGVFGEALGGGDAHAVSALSNGTGGSVIASNLGSGPPLELHSLGAPMSVDSSVKVKNLNADLLDSLDSDQLVIGESGHGGRLVVNRLAPGSPGNVLLNIPGMGELIVDTCTGSGVNAVARLAFDTVGTGNVDFMFSGTAANPSGGGPGIGPDIGADITSLDSIPSNRVGPTSWGAYTLNIARNIGGQTKMVTIWVSWYAVGCRFQAQALASPQL